MPQGDGTGPNGQGPMTGRAMGYCAGFNAPGFMNVGFGRGMGRAVMPVAVNIDEKNLLEDEKKAVEEEINYLKEELAEVIKRLKDLKKQD